MKHLANWIEIPVIDLSRAQTFYQKILQEELQSMDLGSVKYALFPAEDRFNCGALALGDGYVPSQQGVTVYLNGGEDLDVILARVEPAGGTILLAKTLLGKEAGYIAFFLDTEGNKIGVQNQ